MLHTTRYCGTEAPPDYVSNSNELHITFRSDYSISHSGFRSLNQMLTFRNMDNKPSLIYIIMVLVRMGYEAVCGGEFTSPSGVVSSPYHPGSYPRSHPSHDDNDYFIIITKYGNIITVKIVAVVIFIMRIFSRRSR